MAKLYALRIKLSKMKFEDVPSLWQEETRQILKDKYNIEV